MSGTQARLVLRSMVMAAIMDRQPKPDPNRSMGMKLPVASYSSPTLMDTTAPAALLMLVWKPMYLSLIHISEPTRPY